MGRILREAHPPHITTASMNALIEDWIFSKRDRQMLKHKLIDGMTYEAIAEEFGMSLEQTKRIIKKGTDHLKRHF